MSNKEGRARLFIRVDPDEDDDILLYYRAYGSDNKAKVRMLADCEKYIITNGPNIDWNLYRLSGMTPERGEPFPFSIYKSNFPELFRLYYEVPRRLKSPTIKGLMRACATMALDGINPGSPDPNLNITSQGQENIVESNENDDFGEFEEDIHDPYDGPYQPEQEDISITPAHSQSGSFSKTEDNEDEDWDPNDFLENINSL